MSAGAQSMTRLGSVDYNVNGTLAGSVHFFGLAAPTSGATPTLTANVAKSGFTFDLGLASISLTGVDSATGVVATAVSTAVALNLSVTSAVGHRPFWAYGAETVPQDFNRRTRYFNLMSTSGAAVPRYMIMADALGAASLAATTGNTAYHCCLGLDLVPV
jgi:hypothetical protein